MNGSAPNPFADINSFKRRSSLFKPTLEDDDVLKQSLSAFIQSYREQELTVSDAPITWERLSTGYRIIDFQVNRTEELLELLKVHYFCSNQSCAASTLYIDSNTINKYKKFILELISNSNSFCAIEEGTGEIVGVAMAKIAFTEEENNEEENIFTSKDIFNVLKLEKALLKKAKLNKNDQFDKYYCIHIVCVKPKYYGKGIGTSLVRACLSKAQEQRCPLCIGIFSAGPSQTIAQRFGFEMLAEMPWINVKQSKSNHYHDAHVESSLLENSFVTCMGLLLPPNKDSAEDFK